MVDSLRIGRCTLNYRVPRGSKFRLGDAEPSLRMGLSNEVARIHGEGEGVWLIRTLRVRAATNADWSQSQIAFAVGREVSKALQKTIDAGPDGIDVLWFPSRSAFFGRFLVDRAEGRAFSAWPYREFERWSNLASNAALREAIVAEPDTAREALADLLPGELNLILRQLTGQDSEKVFLALAPSNTSEAASLDATLNAFEILFSSGTLPTERRSLSLALLLEAIRNGQRPNTETVRDVAALIVALRKLKPTYAQTLAALLREGDFRGLVHEFGPSFFTDLVPLATWQKEHRRHAVQTVADRFVGPTEPAGETLRTQFGGMLHLLPLLAEFSWQTDDWPRIVETPADALLRFLTVVAALGQPRNRSAFADPVLRFACGIPREVDVGRFAEWANSVPPLLIERFRQGWLDALFRRGAVEGRLVRIAKAPRRFVAADARRGVWVFAETSHERLIERSRAWSPTCECEEGSNIGAEWHHATLDPIFGLPKPLAAMLRLSAQSLLREFAWQLPGFSTSSLPYLYENFLDFSAIVDIEEERFLAQIENPPLHLILSMNGMSRQTFRLPATGDRPWVLTQRF